MLRRLLATAFVLGASLLPAGTIRLKNRTIETGTGDISVEVNSAPGEGRRLRKDRDHVMVEFRSPVTQELLAQLAARNAVVTSAIGSRALMLAVKKDVSLAGLDATWAGRLLPGDKLSSRIKDGASADSAWVVEFHKDVTPDEANRVLRMVGLTRLATAGRISRNQAVVRGDVSQLEQLADWDEVGYIFPASSRLLTGRDVVPCSGALIAGEEVAQYVVVGNGWTPNSPTGVTLNYVFTTLTTLVPASQVQTEIVRAFHAWSAISNIQFVEGSDSAAPWTVAVEFGTSVNNDPTPFDPSGTILAHTYYPAPPNPEPIAGDLHFNPAENWHVGASTDIYTVALHEIGHALGLGHTDDPDDVMYPYYQFGTALSSNDIGGAQALYGLPGASAPAPAGNTPFVATPMAPSSPLSLLISTPANGMRTTGSTAAITGSLVNASGTSTVVWQSNGGHSGQATGTSPWAISPVPLSIGVNLITVSATDNSQRTAHALMRITRLGTGGNSPPPPPPAPGFNLNILSPANGISTTADAATVTGTASDPAGIAQVTWQTNSGASGTALGTTAWTASGIPLFTGPNIIIIRVYDGNEIMHWSSITINGN